MNIIKRNFAPHTVTASWKATPRAHRLEVHFGLHHIKGNSSPYFSITAELSNGYRVVGCGCMHEEILKHFPGLQDMVDLHLSDIDGAPMHADGNGWYWLAGMIGGFDERYHGGSGSSARSATECAKVFASHARIADPEAWALLGRINKTFKRDGKDAARKEFSAWIDLQRPRWKAEANAAIRKYELGVYGDQRKTPEELLAEIEKQDAGC